MALVEVQKMSFAVFANKIFAFGWAFLQTLHKMNKGIIETLLSAIGNKKTTGRMRRHFPVVLTPMILTHH